MRIDLKEVFTNLGQNFWKMIGTEAINRTRKDAGQGIFQTDEPWKKTYSIEYAERKERGFREPVQTKTKTGKVKTKMVREEAYKGVSIVSRNTSFVDMTVTGQTLRGMKVAGLMPNGVTITFELKDAEKIVGNQRPGLNRRLVGLNKKNKDELGKMIRTAIDKNILGKRINVSYTIQI